MCSVTKSDCNGSKSLMKTRKVLHELGGEENAETLLTTTTRTKTPCVQAREIAFCSCPVAQLEISASANPATMCVAFCNTRCLDGCLPILESPQSPDCVRGLLQRHALQSATCVAWMAACQSWSLHSLPIVSEDSCDNMGRNLQHVLPGWLSASPGAFTVS